MIDYTLQKELDYDLGFAERWACAHAVVINAGEHTIGRKVTSVELAQIIGECFMSGAVSMCNYKHDKYVRPRATPPDGWGSKANPEWHNLVENWKNTFRIVGGVLGRIINMSNYELAIMRSQYETLHYCLKIIGVRELVNPDPTLYGPIEKYRSFV